METRPPTLRVVAAAAGWRLSEVECHVGAGEAPFEERHDAHLMAIVKRGTFTYHGANGRSLLHGGAVLLGHRGNCYAYRHDHAGGDVCLALQIDDEMFHQIAATSALASRHVFPLSNLPVSGALLPAVVALSMLSSQQDRLLREGTVLNFAAHMLRHLSGTTKEQSVSHRDEQQIGTVLRFIDDAYCDRLELGGLAAISGFSKFHFLRLFKKVAGTTPYQHVQRLRLRRAAALLGGTTRRVTEIAFDCGFGDLSTFNHGFKACYGICPSAYRRRGLSH